MRFCWYRKLKIHVVCRTKANQSFCSINNKYQSPRCWGKGKSKLSAGKATLGTLFACFWNCFFFPLLSLRKECPPWILYQSVALSLLSLSTYCDSGFCLTFTKMCHTRSVLCRLCWAASLSYCILSGFFSFFFSPLVFCNPLRCTVSENITLSQGVLICTAMHLLCHNLNWGFGDKHISAAASSKILGQVAALLYVEVMGITVNICLGWYLSNKSQAGFGLVEWRSVN